MRCQTIWNGWEIMVTDIQRTNFDTSAFTIFMHIVLTGMTFGLWIPIYLIYVIVREVALSRKN